MWLNPALSYLHRAQSFAKWQRLAERLRSPRRFVLSLVAIVLAVVWLGNAAISIVLRDPYPIETLEQWVPIVLMTYGFWHLLKVAWQRPEVPIEWTAAEEETVCAGPFSRRQVLAYRLTAVMSATLLKALCVSLLLLPDFPVWIAGFAGVFLALSFLELLRMTAEITAHFAPAPVYRWFRVSIFALVATMMAGALATSGIGTSTVVGAAPGTTIELLRQLLVSISEVRHTWVGIVWEAPFATFAHVILAPSLLSAPFAGWLALSLILVALLACYVFWVDRAGVAATVRAEQNQYQPRRSVDSHTARTSRLPTDSLPRVPRLCGAGPFVWRQIIGAFGHRTGLVVALVPPTVLALLPLAVPLDPSASFLQVTGGLVFYSFLLLPAALKFDFRRDYDRLYAFKMLPTSPSAIVVGQLATPVLLTSAFQLAALSIAVAVRPVAGHIFLSSVALLVPLNVFIFASENFLFLVSPVRLSPGRDRRLLALDPCFHGQGTLFRGGAGGLCRVVDRGRSRLRSIDERRGNRRFPWRVVPIGHGCSGRSCVVLKRADGDRSVSAIRSVTRRGRLRAATTPTRQTVP